MQKNNTQPPQKPKPKVELTELLAYNATASARKLLQKYGRQDAVGYDDLQSKLDDLYKYENDKIAIEKEFAEIHPHRDFILKYLSPPPTKTNIILPENTSALDGDSIKQQDIIQLGIKTDKFLITAISIVAVVGIVVYATSKHKSL